MAHDLADDEEAEHGGLMTADEMLRLIPDDPETGDPPDIDDRLTDVLHGSDYVTHEGLIDAAHKDGLRFMRTEPVVVNPDGFTMFRAVVATDRGVYSAYGDADPEDSEVNALVRVAETRAMSRALRTAVNSGAATLVEMPEGAENAAPESDSESDGGPTGATLE